MRTDRITIAEIENVEFCFASILTITILVLAVGVTVGKFFKTKKVLINIESCFASILAQTITALVLAVWVTVGKFLKLKAVLIKFAATVFEFYIDMPSFHKLPKLKTQNSR